MMTVDCNLRHRNYSFDRYVVDRWDVVDDVDRFLVDDKHHDHVVVEEYNHRSEIDLVFFRRHRHD